MSNIQIPNLPAVIALNGTELFEAVQSGVSVKIAATQLATYVNGVYTPPSISTQLDTLGNTQGSILYRDTLYWATLPPGPAGQVLTSQGTGAAPIWDAPDWPAVLSVLNYIPQTLWAGIAARTYTGDVLPYLQAASDAATSTGRMLLFPAGRYYTFGELHLLDISCIFEPGAEIYATRDDLACIVAQGNDITLQGIRTIGVYDTPSQGANPAGSRIQRNSSVSPYNILPYTQGGLARCPFRDRNAGIFLINADRAKVIDPYAENFNIGVNAYGSYVATTSDPGTYTAYDWRTDGTFDPGNGNAPIGWPASLWNDSLTDVGYMYDLQIVRPRSDNCDQGVFLVNQVRARLIDPDSQNISFIQTSPPHGVYWTSTNGLDFPNVDCVVENAKCYNSFWSSAFKFEFHNNLNVNGAYADTAFAGIYSNDCDDSLLSNMNFLNISTPFAIITGSWSAGSTTVTVSDSSQIVPGYFLSADLSSYGLPRPAEVATIVDATHVTLTAATTAASPGTVNLYIGTDSASSIMIADKGSQRTRFVNLKGAAADGQDYVFGFDQRASSNRVLTNTALTSAPNTAGTPTLTFATATFPSQVGIGWIVRMLPYFLTAGTTITNRVDAAGTTTLTLSDNLLANVPAGIQAGFYREITIATTVTAAAETSTLTFASTTGIATNWYVAGSNSIRNLTKVSSLTSTTVTLSRPLSASIPSGTSITFRSDRWSNQIMPDQCEIVDSTISMKRTVSTMPVQAYRTQGSFCTFSNCKTIANPVTGTSTRYAMYIGGSPIGCYNNRIIDPTLLGIVRIVDVDYQSAGLVVDARNAQLMSGTDASTVHDASTILSASKFILDGVRSGTFTPVLVGATIAGSNTYSTQQGDWTRVNQMVWFRLRLSLTSVLSTGSVTITGLPFTASSTITTAAIQPGFCGGVTVTSGEVLDAKVLSSSSTITLFRRTITGSDPALNAGAISGSALVTASIAAGVMTVTVVTNGVLAVGQVITSGASIVGTISSLGSGTGGTGTYNLSGGVNTGSGTMSASGGTTTGRFDISGWYSTSDAF